MIRWYVTLYFEDGTPSVVHGPWSLEDVQWWLVHNGKDNAIRNLAKVEIEGSVVDESRQAEAGAEKVQLRQEEDGRWLLPEA